MTLSRSSTADPHQRWPLRTWIVGLLAWPLVGAFVVGVGQSGAEAANPLVVLCAWVPWGEWIVLMPIVVELAQRVPFLPLRRRSLAVHMGGVIAVSILHELLMLALSALFPADLFPWKEQPLRVLFLSGLAFSFLVNLLIYGSSVIAIQAHDETRRSRQQELETSRLRKEMADAEFRLLESHVHPRLLMTTLTTLEQMLEAGTPASEDLIESFSRFLRLTLQRIKSGAARLSGEIDLIEALLHLQRTCHGGTFTVERTGDAEPEQHLDLQPIIDAFADVTSPWKTLTRVGLRHSDSEAAIFEIHLESADGAGSSLGAIEHRLQALRTIDVDRKEDVMVIRALPVASLEAPAARSSSV